MAEQLRQLPTNEVENSLLKAAFKDNEYLLKVVRSLFFGFSVAQEDKEIVQKTFSNPELRVAVRKKIYPLLSNEVPIGQVADYWMGTESNIYGASRDTIYQSVTSKQKVLDMLESSIKLLEDPNGEQVDLTYSPNLAIDELQTWLLARNLYIKTVETGLNFIKLIADMKEETEEAKQERLVKDSNK